MLHPASPMRLTVVVGAIVLMVSCQFVEAQTVSIAALQGRTPSNAALQARARMQQQHKQTGSVGDGYRPWSASTYQNSAMMHAQTLNTYGENCQKLPSATVREHVTEIQRNITATKTELAKLGPEAAKEAEVKDRVDALQKHLAECEKLCGMMEKTIGKDGVETAEMCTHCSGLVKKLKAVQAEHQTLLKELGIEAPASATDHAEHEHKKTEAAPTKKEK